MSGVNGLKDFLCNDHLFESFYGGISTYESVLESNFHRKRIQEDGHYRENPSNHELLTVRELIVMGTKKCLGAKSQSNLQ